MSASTLFKCMAHLPCKSSAFFLAIFSHVVAPFVCPIEDQLVLSKPHNFVSSFVSRSVSQETQHCPVAECLPSFQRNVDLPARVLHHDLQKRFSVNKTNNLL